MSGKVAVGMALAMALVIPLAGCAGGMGGKARLSAANMCKAAGGTYSVQTRTCNPGTQNEKAAKAMCDAHGGIYMQDLDMCEVEGTK